MRSGGAATPVCAPVASAGGWQSAEATLFVAGVKPALLEFGPGRDMYARAAWFRARGWWASVSDWEFDAQTPGPCPYSNLTSALRPAGVGSDGWHALVVAGEVSCADRLMRAYASGDDDAVGALLGYPQCCIAAFGRRWPQARERWTGDVAVAVVVEEAGRDVTRWPWALNVFGRYFGFEVIQHFPCGPDCSASRTIAARHVAALSWAAPDRSLATREALTGCAVVAPTGEVLLAPGAQDGLDTVLVGRWMSTDPNGRLSRHIQRTPEFRYGALAADGARVMWFGEW